MIVKVMVMVVIGSDGGDVGEWIDVHNPGKPTKRTPRNLRFKVHKI